MSQITVSNLTFCYEGSYDNIFDNVSFVLDTDWKLGFIGRNGKGKTTLLRLLLGEHEYRGSISTSAVFDYFPYTVTKEQETLSVVELFEQLRPELELWRVFCELEQLALEPECLYRPFDTLSHGERTKAMLALLFSQENFFLLIDEPTNHLDAEARQVVGDYLKRKKGFILVSHDRELLDACIDHVLVLNRASIRVEKGNFSSWWENKERGDNFSRAENEKHLREIGKLKEVAERTARWADKNERTKIGFDPIEEHDRFKNTRAYIGAKTKKLQSRVKSTERRIEEEITEKEGLLKDIENPVDLKLMPMEFHKEVYVLARNFSLRYCSGTAETAGTVYDTEASLSVLKDFSFTLHRGERILMKGANGCGKSSFLKAVLNMAGLQDTGDAWKTETQSFLSGILEVPAGLKISYVNQDTSFLKGSLTDFAVRRGLDESLLKALLRQLDFERVQFDKRMEEYSEGQKKKVLLAASLLTPAHLYIWDEPLNFIDVFSRMQLEKLILKYQPTMLLVEHDAVFGEKVATRIVEMNREVYS
ncbi:MAG: ribosomal protection-like ABC-F family protein [Acetatifactor sp.]